MALSKWHRAERWTNLVDSSWKVSLTYLSHAAHKSQVTKPIKKGLVKIFKQGNDDKTTAEHNTKDSEYYM